MQGEYKDNWTDRGSIQHKKALAAPVDISILLLVKALIVAAPHSWGSNKLAGEDPNCCRTALLGK
uniref:Uncharacterized protein n=1 Tax=Aegilops tauschii subsp. strangulata TaxID=200361 RepID=A0A453A550_AEGTS